MEAVTLSRIEPEHALQLLAGVEALDPRRAMTQFRLAEICHQNLCFAVQAPGGQAVYVLQVRDNHCQVLACKGAADVDLTRTLLPIIEAQCKHLDAVSFQTARPGLVRKARAQGYQVAGWILRKDMQ